MPTATRSIFDVVLVTLLMEEIAEIFFFLNARGWQPTSELGRMQINITRVVSQCGNTSKVAHQRSSNFHDKQLAHVDWRN